MVSSSQDGKMCIGDVLPENHQCVNVCPVCYIFTRDNLIRILSGETIELGIVDLFLEVARIGCRMCEMLCNMWSANQEVRNSMGNTRA